MQSSFVMSVLAIALASCSSNVPNNNEPKPDMSHSESPAAASPSTAPAADKQVRGEAALPGLPGANGARVTGEVRRGEAPAAVKQLLQALPATGLPVSAALLSELLAGQFDIAATRDGGAVVIDTQGPDFRLWVRTFPGSKPDVTGFLLQLRSPCDGSAANAGSAEPCTPGMAVPDSGLRAYRLRAGQPLEDVTTQLRGPLLDAAALKTYQDAGASEPFLDASRAVDAPALRWVLEADPDRALPDNDSRTFGGSYVHAGFLVWNGETFEVRDTVPAELWPCPAGTTCGEDRFVLPGQ